MPPGGGSAPGSGRRSKPPPSPIPRGLVAAAIGLIGLLLVVAVVLAAGGGGGTVAIQASQPILDPSAGAAGAVGGELVVDVGGAVVRPGVYRLAPGSRVADAITAAGGYAPRVDASAVAAALNLAALLTDGQQVVVPSRDNVASASGAPGSSGGAGSSSGVGTGQSGGLVDLNRATQAELEALPGIGPVSAGKIIASRAGHPFAKIDDLRTRKLVGQKTFDGLRDLVTVR
jgi:competence protein ComEA